MLDLGSIWYHDELFPLLIINCNGCGRPLRISSGVIREECYDIEAVYLAYIPDPCDTGQPVTVHIRNDLDEDDPKPETTETYEVWVSDGKALGAITKDGRKSIRELVSSFSGDEQEYELIDFIVRADQHILPSLEKRQPMSNEGS